MVIQIKTTIGKFLKNKQKEIYEREKIAKIVEKILDPKIKHHVRLAKIYKKTLVFYTDSSVSSFQLNLLKSNILKEVCAIVPKIEKIKIRIGKLDG